MDSGCSFGEVRRRYDVTADKLRVMLATSSPQLHLETATSNAPYLS
jgi:hypothetical protein